MDLKKVYAINNVLADPIECLNDYKDTAKTFKELYDINGPERYGQDKFGQYYTELYELIFKPFQTEDINIFEVGYCDGGSTRLWLDYFTKAKVRAIDNDYNAYKRYIDNIKDIHSIQAVSNINTARFSLDFKDSNDLTIDYFKGVEPTIAIDDGSHKLSDQVNFIKVVYPVLKPGGLLIIEDIQNIDESRPVFESLGIPCHVADFRSKHGSNYDSVLVIYQK